MLVLQRVDKFVDHRDLGIGAKLLAADFDAVGFVQVDTEHAAGKVGP